MSTATRLFGFLPRRYARTSVVKHGRAGPQHAQTLPVLQLPDDTVLWGVPDASDRDYANIV